jgi:DNA-directed RNA polymerase alpha subunit
MMTIVINASELKVGQQVPEADGFLFDIIEIVKETEKTITVRLASDFSSIKSHWSINGGVLKTFRKSTKIYTMSETHDLEYLLNNKEITQRTFNTFKRAGYNTLEEIKNSTVKVLEGIYNMSKPSLKEINTSMLKYFSEYKQFNI